VSREDLFPSDKPNLVGVTHSRAVNRSGEKNRQGNFLDEVGVSGKNKWDGAVWVVGAQVSGRRRP
jgi:hypothetical protein